MKYLVMLFLTLISAQVQATEPPQFVRFRPVIVSTYEDTRISGFLSVTLHVQANNREARERVERARPKLQDAFTRAAIELGQLYVSPKRKLDFHLVARRMQAAASAAVPGEKIRVYVVDASTRRV
jgi:hypothetical protein